MQYIELKIINNFAKSLKINQEKLLADNYFLME